MKASEILRKAAEGVSNQRYSIPLECPGVVTGSHVWHRYIYTVYRAKGYFRSLFHTNDEEVCRFPLKSSKNHFIIALLLTADMAESVGD